MKRCLALGALLVGLAGCNPTIRIEAPDKPIEINATITIDHKIEVAVKKELDQVLTEDSGLF
ncbi:MAG: YnbE family lipoprotein [Gammaproteobacteria bacterium]|nr:MAG: YnbE family lipoprotein [Gammaproteobacteria bacterium]